MRKTVWVLGAGFARSLGAPLLADLFRQEELENVLSYFPEGRFPGLGSDSRATQTIFNWGKDVEHLWADAEQFLSFVDDAYSADGLEKRSHLDRVTDYAEPFSARFEQRVTLEDSARATMRGDLQRASRRALAAETSRFMMTAPDGELWLPYKEWAKGLKHESDTILTFNYDVLLDVLGNDELFSIPLPQDEPKKGRIPVFKLHGSTNWRAVDGGECELTDHFEALVDPKKPPAIAAPGKSKSANGVPPFPLLWEQAEKAIELAQWVIFVGYRFPPTDALARLRLGRALARQNGYPVRRIDTVLGPDVESNDSRRLSTLIEAARGNRSMFRGGLTLTRSSRVLFIHRQPLWAEDFLPAYDALASEQPWLD